MRRPWGVSRSRQDEHDVAGLHGSREALRADGRDRTFAA